MYKDIIEELKASETTLVAVSKTQSIESIQSVYNQGQRIFGENRVQELVAKQGDLPKDIQWHLIGSLQTNKVKQIVPFISMIHSVDSYRLIKTINDEAAKKDKVVDILLQQKIAVEMTKQGFDKRVLIKLLEKNEIQKLPNVRVCGVMGMASFTDNEVQIAGEFKKLKKIYRLLKEDFFPGEHFTQLSMGMSSDYKIAVEMGSTMVRIGSLIFGARS